MSVPNVSSVELISTLTLGVRVTLACIPTGAFATAGLTSDARTMFVRDDSVEPMIDQSYIAEEVAVIATPMTEPSNVLDG